MFAIVLNKDRLQGGKYIVTNKESEKILAIVKTAMWGMGNSYPNVTAALHFRGDLAFVKTEGSTMYQVLAGPTYNYF